MPAVPLGVIRISPEIFAGRQELAEVLLFNRPESFADPQNPSVETGVSLGIDISLTVVPGSAIGKTVKTIAIFTGFMTEEAARTTDSIV